jgi:hypothetical protein
VRTWYDGSTEPEEERLIGQAIQAGLIGKADDVVAVGGACQAL